MAKTTNINLNLTEDENTSFVNWRKSIDGNNDSENKSNMQIIDEKIGDHETRITTLESAGGGGITFKKVTIAELKGLMITENLGKLVKIINKNKQTNVPTGIITAIGVATHGMTAHIRASGVVSSTNYFATTDIQIADSVSIAKRAQWTWDTSANNFTLNTADITLNDTNFDFYIEE